MSPPRSSQAFLSPNSVNVTIPELRHRDKTPYVPKIGKTQKTVLRVFPICVVIRQTRGSCERERDSNDQALDTRQDSRATPVKLGRWSQQHFTVALHTSLADQCGKWAFSCGGLGLLDTRPGGRKTSTGYFWGPVINKQYNSPGVDWNVILRDVACYRAYVDKTSYICRCMS